MVCFSSIFEGLAQNGTSLTWRNLFEDYDYDDDGEFVPPTEEELKRLEERRKKSDQVSAELGRRMLQGWGLYARLLSRSGNHGCSGFHIAFLGSNQSLSINQ